MEKNKVKVSESATLFVVCVVQFLTPFMMSAVGVALPAIGRDLSASAVHLGMVEMVYILATSLLLLPAGRMGDIYGRRRIFVTGVVLFTISTILVSLAWTIESFIVFRFFQGSGAALITGTSVAILTSVFPPEKRGKIMGVIVGCVYLGLSAGPTLAGFMITYMGWRSIFMAAVPVEIVALILTQTHLKGEWAGSRGESFDFAGSLLYMFSLFCLIYGVSSHDGPGWLMGVGIAGLGTFLYYEYRTEYPILDVELLLSNRVFAFSNIATLINYAASFGIAFFFSLYLQYVKGMSPQATGGILIVQPVIQAALSPLFGRLADRWSPGMLATTGMGLCALGLGVASTVDSGTGVGTVIFMLAVMGVGFAMFSSPNMTTVMGSVEPRHYGIASSLVATMRTVGMLSCMTVITLIFSYYLGDLAVSRETLGAFQASMTLAMKIFCCLSVVGIFFSMGRVKPGGSLH